MFEEHYTTTPPQQGIAPDLSARSGLDTRRLAPSKTEASTTPPTP